MYALGTYYAHANQCDRDYTKAIGLFHEAIAKDNVESLVQLGILHQYGRGVDVNIGEAIRFFARAAEKGSEDGKAYLYAIKLVVKNEVTDCGDGSHPVCILAAAKYQARQSPDDALVLARSAAETDLPEAWSYYASFLPVTEAIPLYQRAAARDDPSAQAALARLYDKGKDLPKNAKELEHMAKLAAEQNDPVGLYYYAKVKLNAKDEQLAITMLQKSAAQKHRRAQYKLGKILAQKSRNSEAIDYLTRAGDQGYCKALNRLGKLCLRLGDVSRAESAFTRSTNQQNVKGSLELGKIKLKRNDFEGALLAFLFAADKGKKCEAQFLAATIYEEKVHNIEQAKQYYKLAADQKHAEAAYRYAKCVVAEDKGAAQTYYQMAAMADHVEAAGQLALLLLENGKSNEAEKWLKIADSKGIVDASVKLGRLWLDSKPADGLKKLEKCVTQNIPEAQFLYGKALCEGVLCARNEARGTELLTAASRHGWKEAEEFLAELEQQKLRRSQFVEPVAEGEAAQQQDVPVP
jgi:TPR repeat protein